MMRRAKLYIVLIIILLVVVVCSCYRKPSPDDESVEKDNFINLVNYQELVLVWGNVYDFTDFGGLNDNSTDNSLALIEALSYVSENGGGVIYFPAGTYLFKQSLVLQTDKSTPILLAGDANMANESILKADSKVNADFVTVASDNISFTNLLIQHLGEFGSALHLAANNSSLTYMRVNKSHARNRDAAITISGSNNYIGDSKFNSGSARASYIIRFTKKEGTLAKNNTLADSYFGEGSSYAVLVDSDDDGFCQENLTIARNVFLCRAVGQVYIVAVDGCEVLSNMLDCTTTSVILNPDSSGIKNVCISYNYMAQTGDLYNNTGFENRTDAKGGVVTDTAGGGSIQNIVISDNYFWGCYFGVRITSPKFSGFVIENNRFVQSVGGSIYITDSIDNRIEANNIQPHSEAIYNVYIENVDENTVIKNNIISNRGRPFLIANWDRFEDINVLFD